MHLFSTVKLAEFVGNRIADYQTQEKDQCCEAMRSWLVQEKNMSAASAKDVISRINRVMTLTPITRFDSAVDVNYRLAKNDSFAELSQSVKSQIKRAVSLFVEFNESTRK